MANETSAGISKEEIAETRAWLQRAMIQYEADIRKEVEAKERGRLEGLLEGEAKGRLEGKKEILDLIESGKPLEEILREYSTE